MQDNSGIPRSAWRSPNDRAFIVELLKEKSNMEKLILMYQGVSTGIRTKDLSSWVPCDILEGDVRQCPGIAVITHVGNEFTDDYYHPIAGFLNEYDRDYILDYFQMFEQVYWTDKIKDIYDDPTRTNVTAE